MCVVALNELSQYHFPKIFANNFFFQGATILKMLQSFLKQGKDDIMMRGIQKYLKKYQFRNAETSDLWGAISEVQSGLVCKFSNQFME